MSSIAQPFTIQLLANPQGQLTALGVTPLSAQSLSADSREKLSALAATYSCFFLDNPNLSDSDALATDYEACQCQTMPADALGHADLFDDLACLPQSCCYVAGAWFLQPIKETRKDQMGSKALALKLVELVNADAETREIEEVFRSDPALSYHLLRLVNSPAISNGRTIPISPQAIMILGRRQLKRWLNLLLFTSRKDDPRASMLLAHASLRARLMEELTRELGEDKAQQEKNFMIGMFSLLGVMFNQPLAEILAPLKLDAETMSALMERQGPSGELLAAVNALEDGNAFAFNMLIGKRLPHTLELDVLLLDCHLWALSLIYGEPA